jgi:hypothetical protein
LQTQFPQLDCEVGSNGPSPGRWSWRHAVGAGSPSGQTEFWSRPDQASTGPPSWEALRSAPRRPQRVLRDLITFRAAGHELGRCDFGRRTPSATVGRDHQAHCRPDAGDASTPAPGPGRKPH